MLVTYNYTAGVAALPYFPPCQVVRSVPTGDVVLTEVVLSGSGRMLFAGSSSGSVRSLKFPLTEAGEFSEHQAHSAAVTRVSWYGVGQYNMLCVCCGSVSFLA